MASHSDFVLYIADQCSGAGEITTRKMFGDYGIYCNGKIFGLLCETHRDGTTDASDIGAP